MVDRLLRIWRTFGARRMDGTSSFNNFSFEGSASAPRLDSGLETAGHVSTLDLAAPPFNRLFRERVPVTWLAAFALTLIVYLAACGAPRLFDQIDGQYAGAAREMMVRGDWLTPTQNGVPRLQKPPLVYWCELLSLRVFGVNEFAARFPVVLATVGWFFDEAVRPHHPENARERLLQMAFAQPRGCSAAPDACAKALQSGRGSSSR
jgi:hypothetical protein